MDEIAYIKPDDFAYLLNLNNADIAFASESAVADKNLFNLNYL